jgi:HipA-like protein
MRAAQVYFKNALAGDLIQLDDGSYVFRYDLQWFNDKSKPAISLTLPKSQVAFHSEHLFPFFFNMIPEGVNKQLLCRKMRIDKDDYFGMLLEVAHDDTIGAVRVVEDQTVGRG